MRAAGCRRSAKNTPHFSKQHNTIGIGFGMQVARNDMLIWHVVPKVFKNIFLKIL